MTRSAEARLVLAASRVRLDDAGICEIRTLLQRPIDWPAVLQLAIPHGTLPLMAHHLRAAACDLTPADLLRQMEFYAGRIRLRNEQAMAELAAVLVALDGRAVQAVPFKGCILQATLYRGLALREFYDVDLMLRRDQLGVAAEAMQALGYHLDPGQQKWGIRQLLRKDHAFGFLQEGRLTIELHWRFASMNFELPLDTEALRGELETVRIGGLAVQAYGPQSTLLILCAHQARHWWRRLNWLCDIAALLESRPEMDWDAALRRARKAGCERIVLTTLALTRLLLGTPLPVLVDNRLERDGHAFALVTRLAAKILCAPAEPRSRWRYIRMREDIGLHEGNRIGVAWRYVVAQGLRRL
jgi:hypothetical protein